MKNKKNVSDIKYCEYNPRKITKERLESLAHSMVRFGDLGGIVINRITGNLVGGHQRVKIFDKSWPVKSEEVKKDAVGTVAEGFIETPYGKWNYREVEWDLKTEQAANIAANSSGGEFDFSKVTKILSDLDAGGFDIKFCGFDDNTVSDLLGGTIRESDEDFIPCAEGKTKTRKGDMYFLGEHRLICADASNKKQVERLMSSPGAAVEGGTEKASLVFTDPPYGVDYVSRFAKIKNDEKKGDDLVKLLAGALRPALDVANRDAAFYIWHATKTQEDFRYAMSSVGLVEKQIIIWVKNNFVLDFQDYHQAYEPCFYASREAVKPAFYGGRSQSTIWRAALRTTKEISTIIGQGLIIRDGKGGHICVIPNAPKNKKFRSLILNANPDARPNAAFTGADVAYLRSDDEASDVWEIRNETMREHPAQKPVALAVRAIKNSSRTGEIVYDPFAESGTTLIAAEETGRQSRLMEIDPKYCDVIVSRWQMFTGKTAIKADQH